MRYDCDGVSDVLISPQMILIRKQFDPENKIDLKTTTTCDWNNGLVVFYMSRRVEVTFQYMCVCVSVRDRHTHT